MNKELSIKIAEYVESSQKEIDGLNEKIASLKNKNSELAKKVEEKSASWENEIKILAGALKSRGILSEEKVAEFIDSASRDKSVVLRFTEKIASMVQPHTFGNPTDEIDERSDSELDAWERAAYKNNRGFKTR